MRRLLPLLACFALLFIVLSLLPCGCGYKAHSLSSAGEIGTVFVPIFENYSFRRGYEFQLTQAVIEQIQREGTLRVAPRDEAESELQVSIMEYSEPVLLEDADDQVLEAEAMAAVSLIWRDLRTGALLLKEDSLRVAAPFVVPLGGDEPSARREAFKRIAEMIVDSMLVRAQFLEELQ